MEAVTGWQATVRDATGFAKGRENVGTVCTAHGAWSGRMAWHGDSVCVFTSERHIVWIKTDAIVAIDLHPGGRLPT